MKKLLLLLLFVTPVHSAEVGSFNAGLVGNYIGLNFDINRFAYRLKFSDEYNLVGVGYNAGKHLTVGAGDASINNESNLAYFMEINYKMVFMNATHIDGDQENSFITAGFRLGF